MTVEQMECSVEQTAEKMISDRWPHLIRGINKEQLDGL
jgi:hypothetical protein